MEQQLAFFLALAVGLMFGGVAVWLMLRVETNSAYSRAKTELAAEFSKLNERLSARDVQVADLTQDREQLKAELEKQRRENGELQAAKAEFEVRLRESQKTAEEKLAVAEEARAGLAESFRALSAEALQTNNRAFLDLAKATLEKYQQGAQNDLEGRQRAIDELVKPLRESLGRVDANIQEIEKNRAAAYAGITEQVKSLYEAQNLLRHETSNLAGALRAPTVRGRWGEIQLRRVVEMAGMVPYCDFEEQTTVEAGEGRLRPDMIVHLPNRRCVVVDAKVSLQGYLEAHDAVDEETRTAKLAEHAAQIRAHVQRLSAKAYWDQLGNTPEFVVAFLPGEVFFSAALEQDPGLIEFGVDNKVILATPTTLIALLKAVAYGWRQEKLAQNAQEISSLGKTLHDRLCTFTEHLETVGVNLERTVDGYNRAVGSLESRVLVSARRFKDLGATSDKEVPVVESVDLFPRSLRAVGRAVASEAGIEESERLAGAVEDQPAEATEDRPEFQSYFHLSEASPEEEDEAESPESADSRDESDSAPELAEDQTVAPPELEAETDEGEEPGSTVETADDEADPATEAEATRDSSTEEELAAELVVEPAAELAAEPSAEEPSPEEPEGPSEETPEAGPPESDTPEPGEEVETPRNLASTDDNGAVNYLAFVKAM